MKKRGIVEKKSSWSTTRIIAVGFLMAILFGTVLLALPFATVKGVETSIVDCLFTATSSVCVTGLVTVNTFENWSIFGQVVILILIQFGGLGIVTFTTSLLLVVGRKVTLRDRLLIEDAFNLSTLTGLVKFLKKTLVITFIIEGIGAVCYMFVFIPQFGPKGIWVSLFNAVSAFCNAGIDIIGANSLNPYVSNVWINLITMLLIISGGLGFIVWMDLFRVHQLKKQGDIAEEKVFSRLNLHSKIVLMTTGLLIVVGAVCVFAMEYTNPETLGNLSFGDKILASFFQSVTTRTAGFATISQKGLRSITSLLCMLLMMIGGSSAGTAGGFKTTTFALVFLTALATIKGREEVTAFRRTIPLHTVRKAVAVSILFITTVFIMALILSFCGTSSFLDSTFETVSAMGTVGLTRDFTTKLNLAGKFIIILCMYFGRIGPISLAIAFNFNRGKKSLITYTKEDITVG